MSLVVRTELWLGLEGQGSRQGARTPRTAEDQPGRGRDGGVTRVENVEGAVWKTIFSKLPPCQVMSPSTHISSD